MPQNRRRLLTLPLAALVITATALALPTVPPTTAQAASSAASVGPDRPLRVTARAKALRDASGARWTPSRGFIGGRRATSRYRVVETASPALYKSSREGLRAFRTRVRARGTYALTLYFAEMKGARPGRRVFDVIAEGRRVGRVDVSRAAGENAPFHLLAEVPVTDGRLDVAFRARRGRAMVSAVAVDHLRADTTRRALFADEFNGPAGTRPDASKWTHETGANWPDGELQAYTDRAENSSLDGAGSLAITARAERRSVVEGTVRYNRDYTSARLRTGGQWQQGPSFAFTFGRAEARIRVPAGRGIWPAFWMLGADSDHVTWPQQGELDVMELFGSQPRYVESTLHGPRSGGGSWKEARGLRNAASLADGFHTYGVQRAPGAVAFSVDGRTFGTLSRADFPRSYGWRFDRPMFLLLNVAVGGPTEPAPDASTPWPATMLVDWVRVSG